MVLWKCPSASGAERQSTLLFGELQEKQLRRRLGSDCTLLNSPDRLTRDGETQKAQGGGTVQKDQPSRHMEGRLEGTRISESPGKR